MNRNDLESIEALWQLKQMGLTSDVDLAQLNNYLKVYPAIADVYLGRTK